MITIIIIVFFETVVWIMWNKANEQLFPGPFRTRIVSVEEERSDTLGKRLSKKPIV